MQELLYLKDQQIKEFIEKLFVAYRESFSDAKTALNKRSLGLAHHKVVHLLSNGIIRILFSKKISLYI